MSTIGRPFFIYIITIIFVIVGIISLSILGLINSIMSTAPPYVMFQLSGLLATIYGIAIFAAMVNFGLAYIAYKGKKWARWVIVGFTLLLLVGNISNVVQYSGFAALLPLAVTLVQLAVAMVIMSIIVLYGMFRKDVIEYFKGIKTTQP